MKKGFSLVGVLIVIGIIVIVSGSGYYYKQKNIDKEASLISDISNQQRNPEIELYDRFEDGQMDHEEYMDELLRVLIEENLGKDFSEKKIEQLQDAAREARKSKDIQALDRKYKEILTPEEYNKFMNYDE